MIAKPLFSMLVCFSSTLMLAGTAQAQGLFGFPFFAPYNPQPRYASPCGPNGCPTNVSAGYVSRTNCPGGVCNVAGNGYTANYAQPGYGTTSGACGPNGCSTGSCENGQCYPSNGGGRTMPYNYNSPNRTLPTPVAPPREYNSNRPNYYYDELPARVNPPTYLDPRSNPYYGASRSDRYDTSTADRSRSRFDTDRSPFYP